MNEEPNYFLTGLIFLLLGIVSIYFSRKKTIKFRREKYDPFKDKSTGIYRLLNVEVYYKSFGVFIVGILCILVSIIFIFFLTE